MTTLTIRLDPKLDKALERQVAVTRFRELRQGASLRRSTGLAYR